MKTLEQKILDAAEIISKAGRRGNGDWVVVSLEYGTLLKEALEEEAHRQILKERALKIEKIRNTIKKDK